MGLASEAAARCTLRFIDLYVELLCLEAADRVVVEYFGVSAEWVQQQQQPQLEQHGQFEQQKQLGHQQLVQRQQKKLKVHKNWEESLRLLENSIFDRPLRGRYCERCRGWAGRCRVCRG